MSQKRKIRVAHLIHNVILDQMCYSFSFLLLKHFLGPFEQPPIPSTNRELISVQDTMVEDFFQNRHSKKLIEFSPRLKSGGQNLLHLMLQYSPTVPPKFMLKRKDLSRETLNAADDGGDSPLLRSNKDGKDH